MNIRAAFIAPAWFVFTFLHLIPPPAYGAEVAFLELLRPDGSVVELEPGGRFGHVAIRVGDRWLHAHPYRGVELVDDIRAYGHLRVILFDESRPDPQPKAVAALLGLGFDHEFRWDNPRATYCTRLVAELLDVPPRPMNFSSRLWDGRFRERAGRPGLSPDDLFNELIARGYAPVPAGCESMLTEVADDGTAQATPGR